jgi:chromosomal replication initiator protein
MGGKDHSTIMHGCEKVQKNISTDNRLKDDINFIKEKIFTIYN